MKKLTCLLSVLMLAFLACTTVQGQQLDPTHPESKNLAVPLHWNIRLDHTDKSVTVSADKDSADIYFVNMTPGWHITTGPAGIFYHPKSTAAGSYRASTKIHLFDPKGRNEAFGLFIGGQHLDQPNQSYTYFLLRNSGEFLIKNRKGTQTSVVQSWTPTPAMMTYEDSTRSSVPNKLAIQVEDQQVLFFINDHQVASVPKGKLHTNGITGLRINHALNVHVENLDVKKIP